MPLAQPLIVASLLASLVYTDAADMAAAEDVDAPLQSRGEQKPAGGVATRSAKWWERPWRDSWVNVTVHGRAHAIHARRVGSGPIQLFCVQGGPGGLVWDLNFLAVYLDLSRYEIVQYDPLGSVPSACSLPGEECSSDRSWMTVDAFVAVMDQVHRAMGVSPGAVIVAHSFGVICALEFLIRWPHRAGGAVLSDWVASQSQAAARAHWCARHGPWCRMYKPELEEPWRKVGLTNRLLGKVIWGPHGDGIGGVLEPWDVRSKLAALRHVPTLTLAGENDIVFPSDASEMSEALRGDYVYLRDCGHFSFVDRRSEWLAAFERWVDSSVAVQGAGSPPGGGGALGAVVAAAAALALVALGGACAAAFRQQRQGMASPLLATD